MSEKRTDVNELGEFGLIDHITRGNKQHQKSTLRGIGDDAAVVGQGGQYAVISTDMLVEGIHFDMMYTPLKHLGYKAVVVNLSDIYAMNVAPTQVTVSIAISNRYSVEALEELYAGVKKACDFYNVDLIGGDTTSSPKGMIISVTAIGLTDSLDKVVYRSGAKVGDIVCVSGDLGAAYVGLQLLEREKQLYLNDNTITPDFSSYQYVIERQLKPEAAKAAYDYFKRSDLVPSSMMDISDGLSSDMMHICKASGVGAYLEEGKIPLHPESKELALEFNMDPVTCALSGGEDYELLFTVAPEDLDKIRFMPGAYIIGEIVERKDGLKLHTTGGNIHELKAQGWNHF